MTARLLGVMVDIEIGTELCLIKITQLGSSQKVEVREYGTVVNITARDVVIEFSKSGIIKLNRSLNEARKPNAMFLQNNYQLCSPVEAQKRLSTYHEKADKDASVKVFTDRLVKSFRVTADFRNHQSLHKYIEDPLVKAAMDNLVKVLDAFDERVAQQQ